MWVEAGSGSGISRKRRRRKQKNRGRTYITTVTVCITRRAYNACIVGETRDKQKQMNKQIALSTSLLQLLIHRSKIETSKMFKMRVELVDELMCAPTNACIHTCGRSFCEQTEEKFFFLAKINYFNEGAIQYIMLKGNKDLCCNAPDIMVNTVFFESNDGWKDTGNNIIAEIWSEQKD